MIALSRTARRIPPVIGAFAVVAAAGLALAPGAAAAATPIGPNQIFLGQVNGSSSTVNFDVVCPGPATSGHPAGDTVGVVKLQDPILGFGRTGNATAIAAKLQFTKGKHTVSEPIARFTTYRTKKVPTTPQTPCSGPGVVTFIPVNGGPGATAASVPVTFINLGTTG